MAFRSKRVDYTVYGPNYQPGAGCFDHRTIAKARLAAIKLGAGARLRRNINLRDKSGAEVDWWVDRVWEWDGRKFVDITKSPAKGLP